MTDAIFYLLCATFAGLVYMTMVLYEIKDEIKKLRNGLKKPRRVAVSLETNEEESFSHDLFEKDD